MTDYLRLVFAVLIFVTLHFCAKDASVEDCAETENYSGREER